MDSSPQQTDVVVIGAGPAGLTAARELVRGGRSVAVFESDPERVGGLARTVTYRGYGFDIGGHRFFSKSSRIEQIWRDILGDDLLERPRKSRIYYNGRFFSYPLRAFEALISLGPLESIRCALSYARARLRPHPAPETFEQWVTNQFGHRLYSIFFKTYTEKVWGIPCSQISADWAAQRIQGLSLWRAVGAALRPRRRDTSIKTLIGSFRYPRLGPGMMWERCADEVRRQGGTVHLGHRVDRVELQPDGRSWEVVGRTAAGDEHHVVAEHVISSTAIPTLVRSLRPELPEEVRAAARSLHFRDFLIVALIVREREAMDDNWIYIHDPGVQVGRIQNFKSWSPELVPEPGTTCFGMEYFCFDGDALWSSSDDALAELATGELVQLGLARPEDVLDACVVRQPKAYPVYDGEYTRHVATVRSGLAELPGLHLVGRNGMHKYNNQDHAMMTGLLAAENILAGESIHDPWKVNEDAQYLESGHAGQEGGASGLRSVPERVGA